MKKQFNTMKYSTALMSIGLLLPFTASAATVVLADAAADYVAAAGSTTTALTTPPTGWSYLGSTAANGATTITLTAGNAGDQTGNAGFTGVSTAGTAAVQGTDPNGGQYELFDNGDANGSILGTDLLLHPGQGGNNDEFVIVRYTIGDDSLFTPGTGTISGSFRDLIVGGGAAIQSISVDIYQNSTSLFSTAGGTAAQGTPGILTAADGAFNLTGLSFTEFDTIDFVVGINGHFGADETALTAAIGVDTIPEPSTALLGGLGLLGLLRRRR
ncbi:PEP-CTERM sorting domain-containing protein [bacterium]|nr:PEP-CTERM sorting domain-containing protein [bacterium]